MKRFPFGWEIIDNKRDKKFVWKQLALNENQKQFIKQIFIDLVAWTASDKNSVTNSSMGIWRRDEP